MDVKALTTLLDSYPLSSICFSEYIKWLFNQPDFNPENNDLVAALANQKLEEVERLESLLTRSRDILSISDLEFRNVFGFSKDLLAIDPEKVHDILAEPVLVVNLAKAGFTKIRKLPPFIKKEEKRISSCDFIGEYADKKFAIELKTIRMENNPKPQPGKPSGNALIPEWWNNMMQNNMLTKVENKDRKVLSQLINAKNYFSCDHTMLAIYNRRIGPSTLCDADDYKSIFDNVISLYNGIDYIFLVNYFGEALIYSNLNP